MARKLKFDRVLFFTTLLLVCASIVMVYSASAFQAFEQFGDVYYFVTRQVIWAVLGAAVLAVAMRIDYRAYKNDAFVWGLLGILGVMLVAVLFATPVNGTRRWLGFGSLGIQPSELAKVVCVLFTALILERRMHRIGDLGYSLLPIAIVVGTVVALILRQPDFGTGVALLMVIAVMVFAAGLPYKHVVGSAVLMIPVLAFVLVSAEYRVRRIAGFLNPWEDAQGSGYQAVQSLIAIGHGGIFGQGLTEGTQKLSHLPYAHTDFIFAVIGEELGLIGATAVVACFCVIAWRGMRIALRAEDQFGALVALGITTMICAQALVNISVALSLLPTKGIPLPFISAGGSSLLVSLLAIGVLLNISQHEIAERT